MTKKQRVAAAKKAARTRKRNAALGNTGNTKKKNSKKYLPPGTSGVYICHLLKKNGYYCNKTELKINKKLLYVFVTLLIVLVESITAVSNVEYSIVSPDAFLYVTTPAVSVSL